MDALIDRDRGLGSAYERYYFYELLGRWARDHGVESVLEGPVDGMAGVPGVHAVGLARQGVRVTSLVRSEEQAAITRAVYERAAPGAPFRVEVSDVAGLERYAPHDMVIAYHALSFVPDWRAHLAAVAAKASKVLVVTVCNPDNWGVALLRGLGRVRGIGGLDAPEEWRTDVLGPALWRLGRVREHEYFDCPWWPDLQVSPGQSLLDRAKKLVMGKRGAVQFTADGSDSKLADKFVYGPDRWPYFGDDGFADELGPALARHPAFEAERRKWLKARAGHLHGFVVDVSPRTPQERARRRLQLQPVE